MGTILTETQLWPQEPLQSIGRNELSQPGCLIRELILVNTAQIFLLGRMDGGGGGGSVSPGNRAGLAGLDYSRVGLGAVRHLPRDSPYLTACTGDLSLGASVPGGLPPVLGSRGQQMQEKVPVSPGDVVQHPQSFPIDVKNHSA